MSELAEFYGPNAGYVLELYERYQQNPESVDAATRAWFAQWSPNDAATVVSAAEPRTDAASVPCPPVETQKVVGAARLARLIREMGHQSARIDPLGSEPPGDPGLEMATHGLEPGDLERLPADVVGGPLAEGAANARVAMERLRAAYSGSIGYEDDHIQVSEERRWLRESVETRCFFDPFDAGEKREVLQRLTEVEGFERFLHQSFVGQKRFSIEGTDMLVPLLDSMIRDTARGGTREVVMGMAHRGRLNVLTHILGKPYSAILAEFQAGKQSGEDTAVSGGVTYGWSGDVKYHLGARRAYKGNGAEEMPVTLAPNPSHLEFVNPVVLGRARAAQEQRDERGYPVQNLSASLAILIHGDAAFPGQGIVAETLNLSQIPGYRVGGTIHIIVNNQIGFTTVPRDSRSTLYASDLAKGFEIPILHVNADDPHACIAAARMACAYRERFGKDFLIDLVGYRRWGHNEGDEPNFTQPRMYENIAAHPTVRELWARRLEAEGIVTADAAEAMVADVQDRLQKAKIAPPSYDASLWAQEMQRRGILSPNEAQTLLKASEARLKKTQHRLTETLAENGSAAKAAVVAATQRAEASVSSRQLIELNDALLSRPGGFAASPKLEGILQRRRAAMEKPGGIEWGHAEALAFATILQDGIPIRLTGQDSERGTFGHRHLVLHDPATGQRFVPMQALPESHAAFSIYNSPLSENAAVGFEYGYSIHATNSLVLWEAQFGDFANGAQVIIDQFLVSGNVKWQQTPSLVLLLPHGYEGMGPEHSSARLERFLQICADDNLRVANCTTAAQYFHLLRRQAALLNVDPRPLIVMTPKSLLRHPRAGSSLSDLADGRFEPVLDDVDAQSRADRVTWLILCSGKVYVDLVGRKDFAGLENVAAIRVEQLYPFPANELRGVIAGYPNAREIVWLQEEPQNMGAWTFLEPRLRELLGPNRSLRYAGRPESASPSEGSAKRHAIEQDRLLRDALRGVPEPPAAPESPAAPASKRKVGVAHAR